MYIIEFKESWVKRDGKISFCKVLKDEKAEKEVSGLLDQYVRDVSELISLKLAKIAQKYDVSQTEIARINELVEELKVAAELKKDHEGR